MVLSDQDVEKTIETSRRRGAGKESDGIIFDLK